MVQPLDVLKGPLQQQVLLEELDQELGPSSAAWIVQALELLQATQPWPNREVRALAEELRQRALVLLSPAEDSHPSSRSSSLAEPMAPAQPLPLDLQAERAMAAGDWRQAGLLWQQLLRPPVQSP